MALVLLHRVEANAKLYETFRADQSYNFLRYRQALEKAGVGKNLDPKITGQLERVHTAAMKYELAFRQIELEHVWMVSNYYGKRPALAKTGKAKGGEEEEEQEEEQKEKEGTEAREDSEAREPQLVDFYTVANKTARHKAGLSVAAAAAGRSEAAGPSATLASQQQQQQ